MVIFAVTFIITLAILTFIVTYTCVKKKFNLNNQLPQEEVLCEQVGPPNQTIVNNDVELQPNPAYSTYKTKL